VTDQLVSAAERADAIRRIRSKMIVTQEMGDDADAPEKIMVDFAKMDPAQMLADYRKFLDTYDTIILDPEGKNIRLYRGQWTIWSGFPGVGKTSFLRQLVCGLLKGGNGVFVFSGEDDPSHYLIQLAGVACGVEIPSEGQLANFIETYGEKLYIWGIVSVVEHRKILATISHLAKEGKITHAIIDSLTTTDIPMDDYELQRQFANLIRVTAIARGVHIHLVAHPKKPMAADATPRLEDVAGASDLGRLTFNGFFLRRGPGAGNSDSVFSAVLISLKQRTKGWIGEINGYFYADQRQFHVSPTDTDPIRYLSEENYAPEGINEENSFNHATEHINIADYVQRAEYDDKPSWEL
jgi:KaiC/GvpD/RAD55 family RecA-like ATPase